MFKSEVMPDNGLFIARIVYTDQHGNLQEKAENFLEEGSAVKYVCNRQAAWMGDNLIRFINHSDILYNTSRSSFYTTIKRSDSLMICKSYLTTIPQESLRGIALLILNIEQQLRAILPNPGNASYKTQADKLEELVWMSIRVRKALRQFA